MTKRKSSVPSDEALESLLGGVTDADISDEILKIEAEGKQKGDREDDESAAPVKGSKASPPQNGKPSGRKKKSESSGRVGDQGEVRNSDQDQPSAEPTGFDRYGITTSTTKRTVNYTSERFNTLLNTFSKVLGIGKAQFLENILRAHFHDHKATYEELYQEWTKEQRKNPFDV